MRKYILLFTILLSVLAVKGPAQSGTNKGNSVSVKWETNAFNHQVFIENKGQFDGSIPRNEKVLYAVQLGGVFAYFTNSGIVYRYNEIPSRSEKTPGTDPDEERNVKPIIHYLESKWEGANPSPGIETSIALHNYYTYPEGTSSTIRASVFEEITYKDMYPGVDIKYYFLKGKDGLKYSIIVHPGADISEVKLNYANAKLNYDANGDVIITSGIGELTEHAPVSYYEGESGNVISSTFSVNGNNESFQINENYDKNKTLVIDPWVTDPLFSPIDVAYDLQWDNYGNVYAYGGNTAGTTQLTKMDNAGNIQWTYTASNINASYGAFCTDKVTGTSYIFAGYYISGIGADKVNTNGLLVATFSGVPDSLDEQWRARFDQFHHKIIIAGGGTFAIKQAAVMDTDMLGFTTVNALSATHPFHDMALLALDPDGTKCYMAAAKSLVTDPNNFNNDIIKLPLPSLTPTAYTTHDNLGFIEASIKYFYGQYINAMNGAAATHNWLYLYNGDTLGKYNKNTGALVSQYSIRLNSPFFYGGLDADMCNNLFVGVADSMYILDSTYAVISKIKLHDTVYDVRLGQGNNLYACGKSFVTQLVNPIAYPVTATATPGLCGCSATASVNISCSPGPFSYSWSNGDSTQTVTGLCAGSYTVTVKDSSTRPPTIDTASVNIGGPLGLSIAPYVTANIICNGNNDGSAFVSVNGGISPYTYLWSGGAGTKDTASGLIAGIYTITVHDSIGCTGSALVSITQPNPLSVSDSVLLNVSCNGGTNGSASSMVSGGTSPYTYSWAPMGGNGPIANLLSAGIYTITVHDSCGSSASASVTITQPNPTVIIVNVLSNVLCNGGSNGSASATVSGGTSPYTYLWSNTQSTVNATGLSAGTYLVNIQDANGCSATDSVTITQPSILTDSVMITSNVLCNNDKDGSASVAVNGGTAPYTYLWSNAQTTAGSSGLSAGSYSVKVKDANGCTSSAAIIITQPLAITMTSHSTPDDGSSDGTAAVHVNGGIVPYTYLWSPGGNTTDSIFNKAAGSYCCLITDANGCIDSMCVTINSDAGIDNVESGTGEIMVYPNPSNGVFTIMLNCSQISSESAAIIEVYNELGEKVYYGTIAHSSSFIVNLSSQPNGIYACSVITEKGVWLGSCKLLIQK